MHEVSLANNIYDIASGEMKKYAGSRLCKIFIDIGEFTHIDPDALSFAFQVLTKDTAFEGTELEIKRIPLILGCGRCKSEFSATDMVFKCPKCNSKDVEILKGREFRITELGIE